MKSRFDSLVSELCDEIDSLKYELSVSRKEELLWRNKYNEMLNDGIKHSRDMMGNLLNVIMTPGVAEAFEQNADKEMFS